MIETRQILTVDLVDPPFILREVNQRCAEYVELRDSVSRVGFLNSICVRPSVTRVGKFEIVDGRHRVAVARELSLPFVPCLINPDLTDKDILAAQITANALHLRTRPSEYARQIKRILQLHVGFTLAELCQCINKNPPWVRKMLGVARLTRLKQYRAPVDRGEISLEAAYYLSKLRPNLWAEYLVDAKIMPLQEFKALIMAKLRQQRAAAQLGSMTEQLLRGSEPQPYMRPMRDVLEEAEATRIGALILASADYTPLQIWATALKWVIHLDDDSVERQRVRIYNRLKRQNRESLS